MHILVLASLYPPQVGGAPAVAARLAEHLRAGGDEIELITFGSDNPTSDDHARQRDFDRSTDYAIHRVGAAAMDARAILAMLWRVLIVTTRQRFRGRRHDAVLCAMAYPCASMAQMVRFLHRVPYVVYAHGEDVSVVYGGSRRMSSFKSWLLRRSLGKAAAVLANSKATVAKLETVGHTSGTVILPPTIDPTAFVDADVAQVEALRVHLGLDGKRILLTIARLTSPRKGHDIVVQALPQLLKHHPNVHYLVVGAGDQSTLRSLADTCEVSEHLSILSSVTDEEVPLVMNMAEVYVMPSRWDPMVQEGEGFGIVYLEAAAAGKPSVAASTGGSVDAVIRGVTGLTVQPDSVDEVAAALKALLDDPALGRTLGEQGRERVTSQYTDAVVLPTFVAAMRRAAG